MADEFSRAAKVLVRRFDESLGEHGVSTPRSRLLVEVLRSQPIRLGDLATAVGVAQATASTLVDALVRDGLVERTPSSEDRRAVHLNVTPAGERLATAWTGSYNLAAEQLFASLPADQWPSFVAMLRQLSRG